MLLSVILPSYNVAQYIERAVNGLLGQGVEDCEIIIVDDGSTDNLGEVCRQWRGVESVKIIRTENQGVAEARNVGLREAKGEYVYFMDPDDRMDDGVLDDILKVCGEYGCDAVRFGYRKWVGEQVVVESENDGAITVCEGEDIRCSLLPKYIGYSLEELKMFGSKDFEKGKELSLIWRFIFRRELLLEHYIMFETGLSFMEDKLFLCRFFCYAKKLVIYNKVCYNYCVREDGLMKTNFKDAKMFAVQRIYAERSRLSFAIEYRKTHGDDVEPLFYGTLILASIQLLLQLVKQFRFGSMDYVKDYMSISSVERAYQNVNPSQLPLRVRLGYYVTRCLRK